MEDVEARIREALEAGDHEQALALAGQHYRIPLLRFCQAYVRDASVAEDIAQMSFAVATERIADFSGQSSFRTWLFGIARHKALDAAGARQGVPLSDVSDSRWIIEGIGPSTGLRRGEDLAALEAALDGLGEETRTILALRFRDEQSYREISEVFGITEQAARKRVFDALERMRKILLAANSEFFD